MELTLFLTKIFGAFLSLIGLALLANNNLKSIIREIIKDKNLIFLLNILGLVAGLTLVISHSFWTADLAGVITVLGWLVLIKHLAILFWRDKMLALALKFVGNNWYETWAIAAILLGLWLLWNGFNP